MSTFYHDNIPNAPGIYRITCTINSKFYIGSSVDIRKRCRWHFTALERNNHSNKKLQNAWNKYTESAFVFEVIELILPPFLIEREQYWLDKLSPWGDNGFNLARSAQSAGLGMKHTPEAREKIKMAKIGKPAPHRGGYKASPSTIEKLRISHRGKPSTFRGKKHTPESLAKMSDAKIGHKYAPEVYESRRQTLIVIAPDGTECVVHGITNFCKEHQLNHSALIQVAKGKYSQHKGWKARYP